MNDPDEHTHRAREKAAQAHPWRRPLWRIARTLLVAYLAIILLAMLFEESLIFFPSKYPAGQWEPVGFAAEEAQFEAVDGTKLHGWYVPHEEPLAYILYLHGNAGNLTNRMDILRRLHHRVDAAVLILDYRGYGKSDGSPSEEGILQDARAARRWLAERVGIEQSDVVPMGRSLGGGVAVDLTTDVVPRGLILESTFTSMPDVAATHYPFLPVRALMSTRLNSLPKLADYRGPLFQSHGTIDEVVPIELGRRLYEACGSERKQFVEIEGVGHNDPLPADYYDKLREFLQELP